MPCSYCGQWINTNGTSTLGDHMEYAGIREPDAHDVIFPGCHWWWINFPCGVTDEREWGVVGFLRCEACQQPSDDISPEDAAMPPPWPLHHTEVDVAAGRVHQQNPQEAEEEEHSEEPWRHRSHSASSEESARQIGIINRCIDYEQMD